MKIGIDARQYSWTGIGRYVRNLLRELFRLDQKNQYVVFLGGKDFANFEIKWPNVEKRKVTEKYYSWQEQTIFLWQIYKEHLDLLHFTHFNAPIFYYGKFVVTIHDLTRSFFLGQRMKGVLHNFAYQEVLKSAVTKAKKIITVSFHTKKDLQKILHIPERKIKVIHEAVEQDQYKVIDNAEKIKDLRQRLKLHKPFFLYVGVWLKHKNLPRLIEAFQQFLQETKLDFNLVIAGKPDPLAPEVQATIRRLNLEEKVLLPGFIKEDDLPLLYNMALAFVFPSLYEGFGLPPLEAMACGCPVAASKVSSLPEILEDAALFFDPQDIASIKSALETLALDKSKGEILRKRGLSLVDKFSWQKTAKETLKVYEEV